MMAASLLRRLPWRRLGTVLLPGLKVFQKSGDVGGVGEFIRILARFMCLP